MTSARREARSQQWLQRWSEMERSGSLATISAFAVVELLILSQAWGNVPRLCVLAATFGISGAANLAIVRAAQRRRELEELRWVINAAATLLTGHLLHWTAAVWVNILLQMVVMGCVDAPAAMARLVGFSCVIGGVAWLDGAPRGVVGLGLLAGAASFFITRTQTRNIAHMLDQAEAHRLELEAAHAQLQSAHRVAVQQEKLAGLGMLAAGIAHEINNPMSFVLSNVTALLEDLRSGPLAGTQLDEYVREVLPATLDGIRRVNSIVADLRRFARGDVEELVDYDLNEEIQSAVRLTRNRLRYRCELKLDLAPLPEAQGRPRQIVQVIVNLLVNAAQAIPDFGVISIQTRRCGDEVLLSVHDTGIGMDEEVRRHLFQPFFTTKKVGEGTGLGLAVIHGIVEAHRGRIEVESAPGLGSCFTVHLPLRPGTPQLLPHQPTGTWRLDAVLAHTGT